jgi:hypothetical protein
VAGDQQAARVAGLLGGDGHVDVGQAAAEPLDQQRNRAPRPGAGLIEEIAVAGVGDARHAGDAGGEAGQEAADRHVRVHEVRAFGAHQDDEGAEGTPLRQRGQAAHEGDWRDPETFGAGDVQQGAFRGDADHLVAAGADAAHQRQQEMAQGKIDVDDFEDLHGGSKVTRLW